MKTLSIRPMEKADVEYTQDRIKFSFPSEYVDDILTYGAMNLKENVIADTVMGEHLLRVKSYMSLRERDMESIHTAICSTGKNLVPFAYEAKGIMFCFDRNSKSIFAYDKHKREKMRIAQTYSEFKSIIRFVEY